MFTKQTLSTCHLESGSLGAGGSKMVSPSWAVGHLTSNNSSHSSLGTAKETPTGIGGHSEGPYEPQCDRGLIIY